MPSFVAVHRNVDADREDVAEAHRKDQEVGSERGVDYRRYWIDEEAGAVFRLFGGPSEEAGAVFRLFGARARRPAPRSTGTPTASRRTRVTTSGNTSRTPARPATLGPPDAPGGPDPPESERPPPPSGVTTPARLPTPPAAE